MYKRVSSVFYEVFLSKTGKKEDYLDGRGGDVPKCHYTLQVRGTIHCH